MTLDIDYTRVKTVGIIGAGVAGLATARVLIAQGLECTLYERAPKLGGVWTVGYSNFGVQVQRELYEFPDWPLPKGTPDFTPGPIIQKYLEEYAEHFEITPHIRFQTNAVNVERPERTDGRWTVTSEADGQLREDDFDLVVVCIGLYSNKPNIPSFPDQDQFRGEIIHNSQLKSRDQVASKRVAVLGYGKSATDAALESAAVAEQTSIIFRERHWPIPARLAGILPFKWGMLNRFTSTLIPLYQRPTPLEKVIHTLGKPMVWFYWRLFETLLFFQCQLGSRFGTRVSLVPETPIEIDSFGESVMFPRPNFCRLIRKGKIDAYPTSIAGYTPTGVALKSGETLDIDVMILATGWKTDFGFLSGDVRERLRFEDDGFYLYRHMLCPDLPRLVFVGRVSTVSSIQTYSIQARWLGELIKGCHRLPPKDAMSHEIADMKAWKRAWMPPSKARSARLILHMLHYHDELLTDFGANPMRKTGVFAPLKELIAPYEPRDYGAIVSGDWK
jgi:dimethylaniline monooxygenase (N-oxide forming)